MDRVEFEIRIRAAISSIERNLCSSDGQWAQGVNDAARIHADNLRAMFSDLLGNNHADTVGEEIQQVHHDAMRYRFLRDSKRWADTMGCESSEWAALGEQTLGGFDDLVDTFIGMESP